MGDSIERIRLFSIDGCTKQFESVSFSVLSRTSRVVSPNLVFTVTVVCVFINYGSLVRIALIHAVIDLRKDPPLRVKRFLNVLQCFAI